MIIPPIRRPASLWRRGPPLGARRQCWGCAGSRPSSATHWSTDVGCRCSCAVRRCGHARSRSASRATVLSAASISCWGACGGSRGGGRAGAVQARHSRSRCPPAGPMVLGRAAVRSCDVRARARPSSPRSPHRAEDISRAGHCLGAAQSGGHRQSEHARVPDRHQDFNSWRVRGALGRSVGFCEAPHGNAA